MKSIEISQGFGQIGLNIRKPDLQMHIKQPEVDMKIQAPSLDLKIDSPEVIIDLRQSFNSMGAKDIQTFTDDFIADAKQTNLAGIERVVAEGYQMSKAKGPTIGQLAFQDSLQKDKEMVIGLVPSVPPHISAKMGQVKGNYTPGRVDVNLDPGSLNSEFIWGKVQSYLEKKPYINIKA